MSAFPPPPPWTNGFRAQQAGLHPDGDGVTSRKSRGDKLEWLILAVLVAVVVVVLVLK
ncbi:hypothetical protein [Nocardia sp. 348MFTsu5.1]|uniref:hypothetical protein n=1 Tax=Nocardia sp. 348MFTsu5.1 TaxID=1172185 RepID=UPI0003750629|nr:hypothetical protein [Nocardia sp. 348MFTsu5.1]